MTSFLQAIGIEALTWVVTLRKTTIVVVALDGEVEKNEPRSAEYPLTPTTRTTYPKEYSEDYPMDYTDVLP